MAVVYKAFAKLNLTLEVLGKRPDGFHDLASVFHAVSLADRLTFEDAADVSCDVRGMALAPADNIMLRAAELLRETAGLDRGARIVLEKAIPVAAGLGGGSSDAAVTLVHLAERWRLADRVSLADLAAQLGSDVPFFLGTGAAVVRGRGEQVEPISPATHGWLILATPTHALAGKTGRLFAVLTPDDFGDGRATERLRAAMNAGEPLRDDWLVNAFSRAARATFPALAETWRRAEEVAGRPFHLSGAGPSLFALAANEAEAHRAAARVAAATGASAHVCHFEPQPRLRAG